MKTVMSAELVEKDGKRGLKVQSSESPAPVAAEIEQLIQFLGRFRLETEPQSLTMEPPKGGQLTVQMDVRWVVQPSADDSLLLAIRHQAFGWLGIQLSAESESVLLNLLLQRKDRQPAPTGLAH